MDIAVMLYVLQVLWTVGGGLFSRSKTAQFEVHALPNSPSLPTSWAGQLPVPGTKDGNALFFWLFHTEDPAYDDNLIIWFNGGPGCSSLIGLANGNGPISFVGNSTQLKRNPYSWTRLGHVLYVDQPVGTGFSTASIPYPVRDNERTTADFARWLHSFFAYFPHLQSKQIHLIGESYAGIYIPYFATALVEGEYALPPHLRSMSLGDGSWGNAAAMSSVAMGAYMRSQNTLLQIPQDVMRIFTDADQTCGFDDVLAEAAVYPPKGKIHIPGNPENFNYRRQQREQRYERTPALDGECDIQPSTAAEVYTSIFNSTCYGPCATFSTAVDYLLARDTDKQACFDVYDIRHDCNTVDPLHLLEAYFSRADVQAALHVENSGTYSPCNPTILSTLLEAPSPIPPDYHLLPTLVTKYNISLHLYSGEWDMLINHVGAELSIQNMTWRGAQGFSQNPSRLFYGDDAAPSSSSSATARSPKATFSKTVRTEALGDVAGTWAAERGVSYHLFRGAGHSVFANKPREMFAYVRDVVIQGKAG
ncbi:Peptidase S10 serine carboxypeptidase [Penicillium riverlandense]|uniref:Peptidase S10 serine carboxypeptidase n=1 Tax=Penicillium riverlandense TaxID=1903569 RepID=UPI002546C67D|nr:Peptidase S10 serine carboxypeptidase [Penicillium riverlandense]KAJ5812191.1 Peptidase S10 serine carboxypeptidase [Penicillium riverlandense]